MRATFLLMLILLVGIYGCKESYPKTDMTIDVGENTIALDCQNHRKLKYDNGIFHEFVIGSYTTGVKDIATIGITLAHIDINKQKQYLKSDSMVIFRKNLWSNAKITSTSSNDTGAKCNIYDLYDTDENYLQITDIDKEKNTAEAELTATFIRLQAGNNMKNMPDTFRFKNAHVRLNMNSKIGKS